MTDFLTSFSRKVMGKMEEMVLVQRAQRGDLTAFNQLVAAYQAIAFGLACRLLDDGASAETAVQQSVLLAFQRLDELQHGCFLCWLLHMVAHTCRDLSPDHARRPSVPTDPIQHGLNLLPFEQRLIVLLADVYGLSRQEIGLVMDGSEDVVKRMLSSARVALRNLWFGQGPSSAFQQPLQHAA